MTQEKISDILSVSYGFNKEESINIFTKKVTNPLGIVEKRESSSNIKNEIGKKSVIPEKIFVFCDASIAIQDKVAIGAFLILDEDFETEFFDLLSMETKIQYVSFKTHKSTLTEIKTFLHVIKKLAPLENKKILFYTDCQTLVDLYGGRRQKLIERDFKKKNGSPLPHADVYREVISFFLNFDISLQKVKGHKPKKEKKSKIDMIFSLVDTAARKKLREKLNGLVSRD